jgi:hypothetical protein
MGGIRAAVTQVMEPGKKRFDKPCQSTMAWCCGYALEHVRDCSSLWMRLVRRSVL